MTDAQTKYQALVAQKAQNLYSAAARLYAVASVAQRHAQAADNGDTEAQECCTNALRDAREATRAVVPLLFEPEITITSSGGIEIGVEESEQLPCPVAVIVQDQDDERADNLFTLGA